MSALTSPMDGTGTNYTLNTTQHGVSTNPNTSPTDGVNYMLQPSPAEVSISEGSANPLTVSMNTNKHQSTKLKVPNANV